MIHLVSSAKVYLNQKDVLEVDDKIVMNRHVKVKAASFDSNEQVCKIKFDISGVVADGRNTPITSRDVIMKVPVTEFLLVVNEFTCSTIR